MHQQEITSSKIVVENKSNNDNQSDNNNNNLINFENSNEISSTPTSPNITIKTSDDSSLLNSSNQDDEQKLSENHLSSVQLQQDNGLENLSGWNVVASWKNENFQMNEHQNAYLENMFASEIFPRLYLGSQMAASDKAWLEDHHITHILTISDAIEPAYPESFIYKVISIRDYNSQNIITHFDATHKFIQMALQEEGNNLLVHCQAGISRSPTVVIAYIMKARKMSYDDAFNLVLSKRSLIW